MSVKLAVFDCDGTLVDGQASICEAMEAAFTSAQLTPPDRHDIRRIVGLSLPQAIRLLTPDATDEQCAIAVDAYKESFRTSRAQGQLQEPLFDGIKPLLDSMRADGWRLAVATGKSDRGLYSCLMMHGLTDHFISCQTADRHPSKPHPQMLLAALQDAGAQPHEAVMIGDTTFDIEMARAGGVRPIGVNWGYHTAEELRDSGAETVASSPAKLGELLK